MSYAIKIGTNEAIWIDKAQTPPGFVRFDGDIPANPIWDSGLQNIRQATAQEISDAERQSAQQAANDIIDGKDSSPVAIAVRALIQSYGKTTGKTPADIKAEVPTATPADAAEVKL